MIKQIKSLIQIVRGTPRAIVISGNNIPDIRKTSEIYKKTAAAVREEKTLDAKLKKSSKELVELHKGTILGSHVVEVEDLIHHLMLKNSDLDKIVFAHGAPKFYLNMLDNVVYTSRRNEKSQENEYALAFARLCEMLRGEYTHKDTKTLMERSKLSAEKTHELLETLVSLGYKDVEKLLPPPKGDVDAYVAHYRNKAENTVIISISKKSRGDAGGKQISEHGIQVIHPLTNARDYPRDYPSDDNEGNQSGTGDYDSGEFVSVLAKEFSVKPADDSNKRTAEVLKAITEKYSGKNMIILYEEADEEAKNAKKIAEYAGIEREQFVPIIERNSLEKEVMRLSFEKSSLAKRVGIAAAAVLIGSGAFYGTYKAGTLKEAGRIFFIGDEAEIPAAVEPKKLKRKITIPHVEIGEVKYDWSSKKLNVKTNAEDKDGVVVLRGTLTDGRLVFAHSANKDKKVFYDEQTKIELKPGKYKLRIKATDSQNDSGYAAKEFEVVKSGWW